MFSQPGRSIQLPGVVVHTYHSRDEGPYPAYQLKLLHWLANVSPSTITQTSKSLKFLLNISDHFDEICNVNPISLHHTKASSKEDRDKILKQLASESRVFDYVPGRYHKTFKGIHPHISSHLDINKLVTWIKQTRNSIANRHELKKLFQREK